MGIQKQVNHVTAYSILIGISFAHLLNDAIQSLIPAIYPLLKDEFTLSFAQIGLIQLTFQFTASILQPFVGAYTDKHPQPYSIAFGMFLSLAGLVYIAFATDYTGILLSATLIGAGSSVFHPESSKLANMASGGKRGLAQSIFQVGGNTGSAIGPVIAAAIVVAYGRNYAAYFAIFALVAIVVLIYTGRWTKRRLEEFKSLKKNTLTEDFNTHLSKKMVYRSVGILFILIFSKYIYMASISSYFTFYLIEKFDVSVANSQLFLFGFLAAAAIGTFFGGPLGDRYGRKYVIWFSILGAAPFALLMPYLDSLFLTSAFSIIIGFILSSAFPAIIVYAQELMPGKIGMISGLFYGLSFGIGGIMAALLGVLADYKDIYFVYYLCSFMLLLGLVAYFLPNLKSLAEKDSIQHKP